jgi:recombination protein RecT
MTVDEVKEHGKRYSKSYDSKDGRWSQDFDKMALKTVLKMLLSKYGILSVDMVQAIKVDQAEIKSEDLDDPDALVYVDAPEGGETDA